MPNSLQGLYSPELLNQISKTISHALTDYLKDCTDREQPYSIKWSKPEQLKAKALEYLDRAPQNFEMAIKDGSIPSQLYTLAQEFLSTNNRLHSPTYMGHQVPPSLPMAGFFEVVGSTSNQATGIYEMGPFPNAAERALTTKMGAYLGWKGDHFDAVVTHGGSLANMTAILAARNVMSRESWNQGMAGQNLAIVASADSHYSVARSAGILGIGSRNIIKAPINSKRQMDVSQLEQVLDQAKSDGKEVFCIVGSSCATPIGAFDDLSAIGKIAQERKIWFHADAAHGGGLLMSKKHRHKLRGIEHADSVIWDAHKMMFVPALCTFIFYKDKKNSYLAFDQDAPYLFDKTANPTIEFDSAVRTLECTKRPLAMALWSIWSVLGPSVFESLVDQAIESTSTLYGLLSEASDFEPAHDPECNILCFRHIPEDLRNADRQTLSDFQANLRKQMILDGRFYITTTRLDGESVLRVTIMNPLTEKYHLTDLMEKIREIGKQIRSQAK